MRHPRPGKQSAAPATSRTTHRPPARRQHGFASARASNEVEGPISNGWAQPLPIHSLHQLEQIAGDIVARADREHPADQSLRQTLKNSRTLAPADKAVVAHAVFAFYRWHGWLDQGTPVSAGIRRATELAAQFARASDTIPDAELIDRAIPSWARQEMETRPAWVRSLQAEPKLWLRARPGQGQALADKLGHCRPFGPGALGDILEYTGLEDLFRIPEFHNGEFEVQDITSQAVGVMCAPQPGETWWDACAGEGGKMLHLSDLMANQGLIWASDRANWRLQHLKRRARRAKVFNYRAALWDGGPKLPTRTRFDGVLVDAPCSGVGTWQRNPHARWTTTPEDVRELAALQEQLLSHAAAAVKPGGRLLYAACTLTRSETMGVADRFSAAFPEFKPLPLSVPLKRSALAQPRNLLWPQEYGGNGMFVAAWRRE